MTIPCIDLMDGKVVQLVQGREKALEGPGPEEMLERFAAFPEIQVIDLDAALGRGSNDAIVKFVASRARIRAGGGVRTPERFRVLVEQGASKVIVGTAAFTANGINTDFLRALDRERLIVALDSRGGRIVVKGWRESIDLTAEQVVKELEPYCSGVLCTYVDKEGMLQGTDLAWFRRLRAATTLEITAAGGITTLDEIRELERLGIHAALGMAVYTGRLDLSVLALRGRAEGCLVGQVAGDALGSLVEFESAASIERRYPGGPRLLSDGGTWNTIAGQPTDDSELALALARSLASLGRYDEEAAARAYVAWYASGPFDIGGTIGAALSAAARAPNSAAAVSRQAANRDSQANGALMRISPLGIYGVRLTPAELAECARRDATLTHPHPVCQDANVVFTAAIAFAIRTGAARARIYEHALAQAAGLDAAVSGCVKEAESRPPADYERSQGWVLIALQNAFYQLLHAPSLEEAVVDTVRRGGDTDTNAAIAGALLGAAWGIEAMPRQWLDSILNCRPERGRTGIRRPRPQQYWPVDVPELAVRLLGAGHRGDGAVA